MILLGQGIVNESRHILSDLPGSAPECGRHFLDGRHAVLEIPGAEVWLHRKRKEFVGQSIGNGVLPAVPGLAGEKGLSMKRNRVSRQCGDPLRLKRPNEGRYIGCEPGGIKATDILPEARFGRLQGLSPLNAWNGR